MTDSTVSENILGLKSRFRHNPQYDDKFSDVDATEVRELRAKNEDLEKEVWTLKQKNDTLLKEIQALSCS
jgi:hypothetical protein